MAKKSHIANTSFLLLLAFLPVAACYTCFVSDPAVFARIIVSYLGPYLPGALTLENARLELFPPGLWLEHIRYRQVPTAEISLLEVELAAAGISLQLGSLLQGQLVFDRLDLQSPRVSLIFRPQPGSAAAAPKSPPLSAPPAILKWMAAAMIHLSQGQLSLRHEKSGALFRVADLAIWGRLAAGPGLNGNLDVNFRSGRLEWPALPALPLTAKLLLRADQNRLELIHARIASGTDLLSAHGTATIWPFSFDGRASLNVEPDGPAVQWLRRHGQIDGKLNISAHASGTLGQFAGEGQLTGRDISWQGRVLLERLAGRLTLSPQAIKLDEFKFFSPAGEGSCSAKISLQKGWQPQHLSGHIQLDIPALAKVYALIPPLSGILHNKPQPQGRLVSKLDFSVDRLGSGFRLSADSHSRALGLTLELPPSSAGQRFSLGDGDIYVKLVTTGRELDIREWHIQFPDLDLNGQAKIEAKQALTLAYHLNLREHDRWSRLIPGWSTPLLANLELDGQLRVANKTLSGRSNVHLTDIEIGAIPAGSLTARLIFEADLIRLEWAHWDYDQARLDLTGRLAWHAVPQLDLDFSLKHAELASLNPMIAQWQAGWRGQGRVEIREGHLSGPLNRLQGRLIVSSPGIEINDREIGALQSRLAWDGKRLRAELDLDNAPASLKLQGEWQPERNFVDMALQGEAWAIEDWLPLTLADRLTGRLSLNAHMRGNWRSPQGTLDLALTKTRLANENLADSDIHLQGDSQRWQLSGKLLGPAVELRAQLQLAAGQVWQVHGQVRQLTLPGLTIRSLSLDGEGQGLIQRATGKLRNLNIALADQVIRNDGPIALNYAEGRFQLESAQLKTENQKMMVAISILAGQDVPIKIFLDASLDCSILADKLEYFTNSGGLLRVQATLQRNLDQWELAGTGQLSDGTLLLKYVTQPFEDVNAHLILSTNLVVVDNLTATYGGGSVKVGGSMALRDFREISDFSFSAAIENNECFYLPWLPGTVETGTVTFAGNPKNMILSGEAEIKQALFSKTIDYKTILKSLKERKRKYDPKSIQAGHDPLKIQIAFHADNNILVDNNFADIELRADLNLVGTNSSVGMIGSLEVLRGTIYFQNDYKILSSEIEFLEPNSFLPYFDVNLETKIQKYTIRLNANGMPEHFTIEPYYSSPPLSNEAIFSLLSLGYENIDDYTGIRTGLGLAYTAAGKLVEAPLKKQLNQFIEFDTVTIDSVPIETMTSNDYNDEVQPYLILGKRLIDESDRLPLIRRLELLFSRSIMGTSSTIAKVEWDPTGFITVSGTWDNSGQINKEEIGNLSSEVKVKYQFR